MPLRSIRARMTAGFALALALLMATLATGIISYAGRLASGRADATLQAGVVRVRQELAEAVPGDDPSKPLEESREALAPDGLALLVVDASGRPVYRTRSSTPSWPLPPDGTWRVRTVP